MKLSVRLELLRIYQEIGHKSNFLSILKESEKYMKVTMLPSKIVQNEVEQQINKFREFIKDHKSIESMTLTMTNAIEIQTKSKEVPDDLKPFQGYSPNPKLTRASSACVLM